MAFLSILFPECVSMGAEGGPEFSTEVVVFGSGNEARNANWLYHRGRWDVAHAAKLPSRWKPLRSFFDVAGGRKNSWLFKDPFDNAAGAGEGVLLTIDGTHKQLAKRFTFGASTYDHPIYKPIASTITITGGGSLDAATGIITGGSPTAWVGSFYKPARFEIDHMRGRIVGRNPSQGLIMEWDAIPIVEVRLET